MAKAKEYIWQWQGLDISWSVEGYPSNKSQSILLIHGFGACKEHWRHNQKYMSNEYQCYAIDLIGFGKSSQPRSCLKSDDAKPGEFCYCFDSWADQIFAFCLEVIKHDVILVGNSIGGVIALRTAQKLQEKCVGVTLIDCAQRAMDDKRLKEQPYIMQISRPLLKSIVNQRWISRLLFANATNTSVIKKVLSQAYPSGKNVDENLINLLLKPSKRAGASESFRGFINIFDDHLAPDLMTDMETPVDLIWGENDPWEPIETAKEWMASFKCIRSLEIIKEAGHCPHDESPEEVNSLLLKIIQATK